jgi:hypothetical protein
VTHLSDEVVLGILIGPYLLLGILLGYCAGLRKRVKRLERRADIEDIQWRKK